MNRTTSDFTESQYQNSLYNSADSRVSGALFNQMSQSASQFHKQEENFQDCREHYSRSVFTDQSN